MAQRPQRSASTSAITEPEVQQSGTWPHALSHEALLRVSDVLNLVGNEFPALTSSKLRFLDAQGLVSPVRTPSGYRLYSPADVERLRFTLRQQRDHFLPLHVIAETLEALDKGRLYQEVYPVSINDADADYLTIQDIAARASVEVQVVNDLTDAGVISQTMPGKYRADLVASITAAGEYLRAGGDLRSLRTLTHAAGRTVDQARALSAPLQSKGDSGHADSVSRELGEAAITVFSAWVRHENGRY